MEPDRGQDAPKLEDPMSIHIQSRFIHNIEVIQALANLRLEWEEAVEGERLSNVQANVGLLLTDVVVAIGLTTEEQYMVLGDDIVQEMETVLLLDPVPGGNL